MWEQFVQVLIFVGVAAILWLVAVGRRSAEAAAVRAAEAAVERAIEKKFRQWEVRFSTFHGRMVEAMEIIRRALAKASQAADTYQSLSTYRTAEDLTEELREVQHSLREARLEFEARSFYFDPDARDAIEDVFDGLTRGPALTRLYLHAEARGRREVVEEALTSVERVSDRLNKAKRQLDEQFRKLAGAEPDVE